MPPATDDASAPPPTADVLGIPVACVDYERTMDWMDATIAAGGHGYICVAATHTIVACQDDPELRAAVLRADMVVPDGQPVRWAMNAMGHRLSDRVYGPDLMAAHCERSARTGTRIFLYGGRTEGALVQLTLDLRRRHPGLQIVGVHAPVFRPLTVDEQAEVAREINAARPDVVWVGLGVPRQEKWMATMAPQLDANVLVGVGAAFDFHAGLVAQAPRWMQRAGLEWLYRLSREPRRLWKRYATNNPRFVAGFARQYVRHLLRR